MCIHYMWDLCNKGGGAVLLALAGGVGGGKDEPLPCQVNNACINGIGLALGRSA